MITELYYWVYLLCGVGASFVVPAKYRFVFFSIYSATFIVLAIGSFTSFNPAFRSPYWVIGDLTALTLLVYYVPRFTLGHRFWPVVQPCLVLLVLCYLAYFKYLSDLLLYLAGKPLDRQVLLPLGISYFSFKLIHYAIEIGRGNIASHGITQFFTYIFLFPIFTAGPIERFDHFQKNWNSDSRREDLVQGSTRIIYGLIKKFLIAGVVLVSLLNYNTADTVLQRIDTIELYKVWGFLLISYLIIYLDFSAYSDIAIGSSRLLGFRIMENFNWPILATNIAMLWKRWHMTLSAWCQSYVYMPSIGLTRNPYVAVMLTFLAVGVWHSAALSWIFWGIYQGVGVSVYVFWGRWVRKKRIKIPSNFVTKIFSIAITNIWMAGSFAFTLTYTNGSWADIQNAFRLLQKYFFFI